MIRRFVATPVASSSMMGMRSAAFATPLASMSRSTFWLKSTPAALIRASGGSSTGASSGGGSSWSDAVQPNYSPAQQQQSGGSQQSTADSLTPHVRNHIQRVYSLLTLGVASAGVSCAAMITTPLGKIVPWWVCSFGGLGALLALSFLGHKMSPPARLGLFFTFTTLEGMSIAGLVKMGAMKGVLGSALIMTGAIFAGMTAVALLAPRGKLLALGGPLFGMLLGMVAVSLFSMFYPSYFAHSLILYGGLLIFSLYISYDTQLMIERARCGGPVDAIGDATSLFINILNIFTRLLSIMGRD